MIQDIGQAWNARVNLVFHTGPRDGASPHAVWLSRYKVEKQFNDLLYQDGVHICVDGPSGTGKTSLVKTQLSRAKLRFLEVQLARSTDWSDFCRRIFEDIARVDSTLSVEVLAGFKGLIPEGAVKLSYSSKRKARDSVADWKDIGSVLNEADICRAVQSSKAILFIDDFEKADQNLTIRISDLCKIATQSFKCKVVVAGTGDVYLRKSMSTQSIFQESQSYLRRLRLEWSFKLSISLGQVIYTG